MGGDAAVSSTAPKRSLGFADTYLLHQISISRQTSSQPIRWLGRIACRTDDNSSDLYETAIALHRLFARLLAAELRNQSATKRL